VLHLSAGNLYGGLESLLTTLARERGCCPEMEPHFGLCFEGRSSAELRAAGAAVYVLGAARVSKPWSVWLARRRLGRVLAEMEPEVVLCHGSWAHAMFAPVVRRHGRPLVFWAHDVPGGTHWLERWARRTPPDLALANSRFTQDALARLFPGVPTRVQYPLVPPPPRINRGQARQEVREELETPSDAPVVVQVSRMEPLKGQGALLRALGTLRDVPGWWCWVVGGPQRPHEHAYFGELRAVASGLGIAHRVRFVGERGDVPRLLAAADVYCQPNASPEAFGITYIEAMYAGLPVVTTALGGAVEILDDRCGVLVPPAEVGALAEALRRLLRAPAANREAFPGGPGRARALCHPRNQLGRLSATLTSLALS
jgi:glycosyltransferase involved in cell wall biosynthesis